MPTKPVRVRSVPQSGQQVNELTFMDYARTLGYLGPLQFIEDSKGRRTAAILAIEAFDRLLQDHWAMAAALRTRDEDMVDWDEAMKELRRDSILPSKG